MSQVASDQAPAQPQATAQPTASADPASNPAQAALDLPVAPGTITVHKNCASARRRRETTGTKQTAQLWKPGQSGNPKGRPKGSHDPEVAILKAICRMTGESDRNAAVAAWYSSLDPQLQAMLYARAMKDRPVDAGPVLKPMIIRVQAMQVSAQQVSVEQAQSGPKAGAEPSPADAQPQAQEPQP